MDITSVLGVVLGIVAILVGMVLKGVSITALINPAAILIIIVGTIASVVTAFPFSELKRLPKILKVLFLEQQLTKPEELIKTFSEWAVIARKEGLLALEIISDQVDNTFLKNGLNLAVEGQSADYIRDILAEEIDAMEERHQSGAAIFSQAGTYAPTLGVLGAVIGLIAALGNMADTEALGHAISAAFVATLMGIYTGYVLWHPFANKLKRKSQQEVRIKEMMIEGILSIIEGEAPRTIEQKLTSYLPAEDRKKWLEGDVREDG
ncbi:flagellar motor stator protein MotA [Peribacillus butanolivorans]|uniref:Flagellar motor protein MotA n=1 Tax=Peribacillus butanolivorans TaxID=421767 RepID=A0AAX0RZ41_9BACI|nr:flagellar motor stator protein MotA [Peribacillus butanolivorans]KQU23214.1 flagellar motor protein MotA [Bacillus sp. Leaf13]AXN39480.1 flagellar motor protein MotA [Peribacillus butanolivorans]KON67545.1 flagellar motor protein MotA [Peribacillus butanolivorans]MCO0596321.1 flagellar motor stator protein MotA [Peribacillus butanolivorans]PEJ30732.1 flagellar motor protein MotA [Peribacillus butanolivorans]